MFPWWRLKWHIAECTLLADSEACGRREVSVELLIFYIVTINSGYFAVLSSQDSSH